MDVLKSKKVSDHCVIAIVTAKEWFKQWFIDKKMPYFIPENYYVVCKWHDYHDGVNSHIEGKETLAICKNKIDAVSLFKSNKNSYETIEKKRTYKF